MRVTVVEYRPEWREMFGREKELLARVVGADAGVVEHVGSTSVEGLAAKPIIDILIGLHDFSAAAGFVPGMRELGYEYVPEYEAVMPDRRYFRKKAGGVATHHVHMVQACGAFWRRQLLFRDYLRANPDAAAAYAALKKELARRDWDDKSGYTDAKTDFIREIEERALTPSGKS